MLNLEEMADRRITGANYITSVNGMVHPNRIMDVHDFLYILDGEWEIFEEDKAYHLSKDDLLILSAGRHHYGQDSLQCRQSSHVPARPSYRFGI